MLGPLTIGLLADHPELIPVVGELRWREWGHGQVALETWVAVTARECGRSALPATLVAIDDAGQALGAVGLGRIDDALTEGERRSREPWLLGLVVRADQRQRGVGRRLVAALEDLATGHGWGRIWVTTGDDAVGFYRRCGWTVEERLILTRGGWDNTVLSSI